MSKHSYTDYSKRYCCFTPLRTIAHMITPKHTNPITPKPERPLQLVTSPIDKRRLQITLPMITEDEQRLVLEAFRHGDYLINMTQKPISQIITDYFKFLQQINQKAKGVFFAQKLIPALKQLKFEAIADIAQTSDIEKTYHGPFHALEVQSDVSNLFMPWLVQQNIHVKPKYRRLSGEYEHDEFNAYHLIQLLSNIVCVFHDYIQTNTRGEDEQRSVEFCQTIFRNTIHEVISEASATYLSMQPLSQSQLNVQEDFLAWFDYFSWMSIRMGTQFAQSTTTPLIYYLNSVSTVHDIPLHDPITNAHMLALSFCDVNRTLLKGVLNDELTQQYAKRFFNANKDSIFQTFFQSRQFSNDDAAIFLLRLSQNLRMFDELDTKFFHRMPSALKKKFDQLLSDSNSYKQQEFSSLVDKHLSNQDCIHLFSAILTTLQKTDRPFVDSLNPNIYHEMSETMSCRELFSDKVNYHGWKQYCIHLDDFLGRCAQLNPSNDDDRTIILSLTKQLCWLAAYSVGKIKLQEHVDIQTILTTRISALVQLSINTGDYFQSRPVENLLHHISRQDQCILLNIEQQPEEERLTIHYTPGL